LALGDEQSVDPEHGGEQERRPQHPRGERAGEAGAVEPEAKDDEGGDGEERHRRQRLQGAQLRAQVLGEDRREGDAGGSHETAAISPMPSRSTWSASGRKRSGSWVTTTREWPEPGPISSR